MGRAKRCRTCLLDSGTSYYLAKDFSYGTPWRGFVLLTGTVGVAVTFMVRSSRARRVAAAANSAGVRSTLYVELALAPRPETPLASRFSDQKILNKVNHLNKNH